MVSAGKNTGLSTRGGSATVGLITACAAAVLCVAATMSVMAAPERWEETITRFQTMDRENGITPGGILFVGSSSIRLWDTDKSFPDMNVVNRGFGGSEIEDSIYFADRFILPHKPRIIAFYAGDNDIANEKTAQRVYDDFVEFAALVHKELPQTRIIWVPIKPSIARWEMAGEMALANSMVRAASERDERIYYADTWTPMLGKDGKPMADLFVDDNLHLSAKGYEMWDGVMKPVMLRADRDFRAAMND